MYEIFPARAPLPNTNELEEIVTYHNRVVPGANRTNLQETAFVAMACASSIALAFAAGLLSGLVLRLPVFEPLDEKNLFSDATWWLLPAAEEPAVIGNESNCDLECSQQSDEPSTVRTLKIPARTKLNNMLEDGRLIELTTNSNNRL